MSCRDQRFKTSEYKDYATEVLYRLDALKELQEMRLAFEESGGTFTVELTALYPPHVYYNKNGTISAKTIDCSNFEKPVIDLIFGGTMNVNDKNIDCLISKKAAGATYGLDVRILLKGV